jgi:hypothetical protein
MADGKDDRTHGRWGPLGTAVAKILDHPRTALAVGVVGLAATVVTFELSQGGSGTRAATSSASGVQFKSGKPPPLNLNEGANCADLEQAALHGLGRTVFIDSPGSIDGGTRALEGVLMPNGRYGNIVEAGPGAEVEVSALLHNSDYSSASEVTVAVHVSPYRGTCWRFIGVVNSRTNGAPLPVGPMLIRLNGGKGVLEYVVGSTRLLDAKGKVLVPRLADSIIYGGITLPLEISGGTTEFVNFRVRIRASQ